MSRKPKLGSVFSSRKNPETDKIEIYEIPPEKVDKSFNRACRTRKQRDAVPLPVKGAPILTVMADFGWAP
jgi:hypothetical protein